MQSYDQVEFQKIFDIQKQIYKTNFGFITNDLKQQLTKETENPKDI